MTHMPRGLMSLLILLLVLLYVGGAGAEARFDPPKAVVAVSLSQAAMGALQATVPSLGVQRDSSGAAAAYTIKLLPGWGSSSDSNVADVQYQFSPTSIAAHFNSTATHAWTPPFNVTITHSTSGSLAGRNFSVVLQISAAQQALVQLAVPGGVQVCASTLSTSQLQCTRSPSTLETCFMSCNESYGVVDISSGCPRCTEYSSITSLKASLVFFAYFPTSAAYAVTDDAWTVHLRYCYQSAVAQTVTQLARRSVVVKSSEVMIDRLLQPGSVENEAKCNAAGYSEGCSVAVTRVELVRASDATLAELHAADMAQFALLLEPTLRQETGIAELNVATTSSARIQLAPSDSLSFLEVLFILFAPLVILVAIIGCRVLHKRLTADDVTSLKAKHTSDDLASSTSIVPTQGLRPQPGQLKRSWGSRRWGSKRRLMQRQASQRTMLQQMKKNRQQGAGTNFIAAANWSTVTARAVDHSADSILPSAGSNAKAKKGNFKRPPSTVVAVDSLSSFPGSINSPRMPVNPPSPAGSDMGSLRLPPIGKSDLSVGSV